MSERRLPLANRFLFNRKVELILPRSTAFFSLSGDAIDKRRKVRTFAYFFSSSMEQEFASSPLAAKICVPGGKTSKLSSSSSFFSERIYFPTLCSKLLAKLKIKLFRFSFWLQMISVFTFDFHFAAQFFACNFGIFIFSQGPPSTFSSTFLQASRVSRHTSSQGESFRSFWEAATYDKLYVIVKQSLLLLESNRNPFCRRPEQHQHHRARSIRFHSSDFSFFDAKVCTAARKCGCTVYLVSFSCKCIYNNVRIYVFAYFQEKDPNVYVLTPRRPTLSTARTSPFPLAELWQQLLDTLLSPTLITFNSCSGALLF